METHARRMQAKVAKSRFIFDHFLCLKVFNAFLKNLFYAYPMIFAFHEIVFLLDILSNNSWSLIMYPFYAYLDIIACNESIFVLYILPNNSCSLSMYPHFAYMYASALITIATNRNQLIWLDDCCLFQI